VDKKLRKKYYNLCNPDEALGPEDKRNVDIDGEAPAVRGMRCVDVLANKIELSDTPVCEFFTGLPGSGKSTELRRLAARLEGEDGAHVLPVVVDAEELIDLYNPIDIPDILVAVIYEMDCAVLEAEGKTREDALKEGAFARFTHWLMNTDIAVTGATIEGGAETEVPGVSKLSLGANLAVEMKTRTSFREEIRKRIAQHMTTFLRQVHVEIERLCKRAQKQGYRGMAVIFDSLEKLRGISTNWSEVLASAERVFGQDAPYLRLPVHTIYTVPPALVLRLNVPVHFMPMLKLKDRKTEDRFEPGLKAARELIRRRLPDKIVNEVFGPTGKESRLQRLIEWSGGYPREIVRLLQLCVAEPSLDEEKFIHLLGQAGDAYRRTVPGPAFVWLARVAVEKRLVLEDQAHREMADLMLANNVVLRYQNTQEWFDVHPAVRTVPEIEAEIHRLLGVGPTRQAGNATD
jgi:hypothetical protein